MRRLGRLPGTYRRKNVRSPSLFWGSALDHLVRCNPASARPLKLKFGLLMPNYMLAAAIIALTVLVSHCASAAGRPF